MHLFVLVHLFLSHTVRTHDQIAPATDKQRDSSSHTHVKYLLTQARLRAYKVMLLA